MKTLIVILFLTSLSIPGYCQDFSEENSYNPPEDSQVNESVLEQQRIENEERSREAELIQDQQPPVETYDNSVDFGY